MSVRVHFNPILANKKQGGILFLKGRKGVSMVELVSYIYLFMIKLQFYTPTSSNPAFEGCQMNELLEAFVQSTRVIKVTIVSPEKAKLRNFISKQGSIRNISTHSLRDSRIKFIAHQTKRSPNYN